MLSLAFYLAAQGDFLDKEIAAQDGGPYSHVELVLGGPERPSMCFSGSGVDGGTRFKVIDLASGKWDVRELRVAEDQVARVGHFCWAERGKPYDFAGVLGFKLPWIHADRSKWFCSEICTAALQTIGLLTGVHPERTTPNQLFRLITGQ